MKISRLKAAVLGAALLTSSAMLARAQDGGQFDLSLILMNAPVADVFGLPTIDASNLSVDVLDSTVYVDGGGKISGFAMISATPETGSPATLILNISGKMGNDGTIPMASVTLKGKGFSDNGTAQGKATMNLSFKGDVQSTTTTTITTNFNHEVVTNCHDEVLSNCTLVTITNYVAITDTNELGNTNLVIVTNTTPITEEVVTWHATSVVSAPDAGNSNVVTTTTDVTNSVAYFSESSNVVSICITNATITNLPPCPEFTNLVYTAIPDTTPLTNEVLFTSAVSTTNPVTIYIQTNSAGTILTTNTLPYFSQVVVPPGCVPVTTNVTVTNIVVATTNTYAEITNTVDLTNGTVAIIVTNTTPWGTNFVETNTVLLTTNDRPVVVVVGAYVTNTAGLPYFSKTTTSGTNSVEEIVTQLVITNVCVVTTNLIPVYTTNTVTTTVIAGTASGSYKSGLKGEATVSLKNVSATIEDVDYTPDMTVNTSIVFFKNSFDVIGRLLAASFQDTGLPAIGTGSASSSGKFNMTLKGTSWGKGSSLSLKGTSTGSPPDITLGTLNGNGKVLGQKIKTSSFQQQ